MVTEDLTGFTAGGNESAKITAVTATRSTVTELIRSDEAWLYKDYGAGHFDLAVGIMHDFDFYIDEDSYGGGAGGVDTWMQPWALANAVNDLEALKTGNENFLTVEIKGSNTDDEYTLKIVEWKNNARAQQDESVVINKDQQYWIRLTITGNQWKLGIYSTQILRDAGDGTDGDIDNLSITLSSATLSFQYLYSVMSRDNFTQQITMYQQNYDIHEAVPLVPKGNIVLLAKGFGII